jgi:Protein of unknown function (DUF3313)
MKIKQWVMRSVVLMVAASLLMTGCFAGKRAGSAKFSGWMTKDDYKLLKKNEDSNKALYSYIKPDVNWAFYTKMLLDPVVVYWPSKGAPPEDVQKAANNFYSILVKTLSKDYEMVTEPGPKTLRVQIAFTSVSEGSGTMQAITSVVPIGIGASYVTDWVTGKPPFAGEASIEGKMTDARSGELLAAAVDRRIAQRNIATSIDTWDALQRVLEVWSKIFSFRLCQLRGEKDCLAPEK